MTVTASFQIARAPVTLVLPLRRGRLATVVPSRFAFFPSPARPEDIRSYLSDIRTAVQSECSASPYKVS